MASRESDAAEDSLKKEHMGKTSIEWTDEVWNPVTGCTKVSQGCKHCYAERMAHRLAGRNGYPAAPHQFDVTLHEDKLDEPLKWKKPRLVFVNSMSDLFHEKVPDAFIRRVWSVMARRDLHTFQVLTKRPKRMLAWVSRLVFPMRRNIWLGVSVEDQATADERIPLLMQTPAAVRFLSIEPLLGPIGLSNLLYMSEGHCPRCGNIWLGDAIMMCRECGNLEGITGDRRKIDWVIVGGESGPDYRPMQLDWARSLRDQCIAAGVPFFFKQGSGMRSGMNDVLDGIEWKQFPA